MTDNIYHIPSYSSVYSITHRAVQDILKGDVHIEEKIDGSQISFKKVDGVLVVRSKGVHLDIEAPGKLFKLAVETIKRLYLMPGWTYRAEAVTSLKHNVLEYKFIPREGFVLYDVDKGEQDYLNYTDKMNEAIRLGLCVVPKLEREHLDKLNELHSVLGGKVEGIVIKDYSRFGSDKKILIAKIVREEFKEIHANNPEFNTKTDKDFLFKIEQTFKTNARWDKAIQHLKDDGKLTETMRDIPALLTEIKADVHKECADEIKEIIYSYFKYNIEKSITRGFEVYYKNKLAEINNSPQNPS